MYLEISEMPRRLARLLGEQGWLTVCLAGLDCYRGEFLAFSPLAISPTDSVASHGRMAPGAPMDSSGYERSGTLSQNREMTKRVRFAGFPS